MLYQLRERLEATRWFKNGDHPLDYSQPKYGSEKGQPRVWSPDEQKAFGWEGQIVRYYRDPNVAGAKTCYKCKQKMHDHGWIDQGVFSATVCPGQWVCSGKMRVERVCWYVMDDKDFQETYVPDESSKLGVLLSRVDNIACAITGLAPDEATFLKHMAKTALEEYRKNPNEINPTPELAL